MILGELGGIYGALIGIPSFFISRYIEYLFISSVVDRTPIKDESQEHSEVKDALKMKLASEDTTS